MAFGSVRVCLACSLSKPPFGSHIDGKLGQALSARSCESAGMIISALVVPFVPDGVSWYCPVAGF